MSLKETLEEVKMDAQTDTLRRLEEDKQKAAADKRKEAARSAKRTPARPVAQPEPAAAPQTTTAPEEVVPTSGTETEPASAPTGEGAFSLGEDNYSVRTTSAGKVQYVKNNQLCSKVAYEEALAAHTAAPAPQA